MRRLLVVGVWLGVGSVVGCGGGGGKADSGITGPPLDCAWLASNNCWKATADLALSCLPAETEMGVMSDDNLRCTYPGGIVVTFDSPIVLSSSAPGPLHFTITGANGQPCLRFDDMTTGLKVVVGEQTVATHTAGGYSVTCPDGSSYSTSDSSALIDCPGATTSALLPSYGYSIGPSSLSVSLSGTSVAGGALQLFSCGKP